MAFWNRKPDPSPSQNLPIMSAEEVKQSRCAHKYRDFHWYIEGECQIHPVRKFKIQIIEPYVCVWCGNRKNMILQTVSREGDLASEKAMIEATKSLLNTYEDKIRPRAYVEDEINDMQLVDRDYLRALALLHPEKLNGMDEQARVALQKG